DNCTAVPLGQGSITDAEIVGVTPGAAGAPGELNGCADMGRVLGNIEHNTPSGIYGQSTGDLGGRLMETGEIHTGPATILSTVSGRQVEEFRAEVNRVARDSEGTHVLLTVTDPELLARTGGIVQGMSGSPILQDGRLVGAVTHVFVNDPTKGYGISVQDMLSALRGGREQAA
ncbi:MAG: SpoIVB peptidase, partial [Oscillospiraceae bacterium]|nr:SpoIVB peptidase [Oscillospiraceae bacterium]